MRQKTKNQSMTVNIAHYDSLTGILSIYNNVSARIRYDQIVIKDPNTDATRAFYIRKALDGEIHIGERTSIVWSKSPIDIENFKRVVYEDRLEQYERMVLNAVDLICKKKADLDRAANALL